jgi:hypothetical protein
MVTVIGQHCLNRSFSFASAKALIIPSIPIKLGVEASNLKSNGSAPFVHRLFTVYPHVVGLLSSFPSHYLYVH